MAITWKKVLPDEYTFGVQLKTFPKKGNLVYEYNPFRNYRLGLDMYEYEGLLYTLKELEDKFGIKVLYIYEGKEYSNIDEIPEGATPEKIIPKWNISQNLPLLREKGELVDFITDLLSFSLDNPVNIIPQYSYDGSVNLILNDGINTPKLINSRFSSTGRNTYEIIDRKGNNDTNIYDLGDEFELDTSLYKRVVSIPKIEYNGTYQGGNLKVGNYYFYFKLSDADGNETDFIGESGLVSVFIGSIPKNIHTGLKNENSHKNVSFTISNLDTSYDYLIAYYSRTTSEGNENANTEYCKIDKKFTINNAGICNLLITGFEDTINVAVTDINTNYNIVDSAKTLAVCLNMLFLGNVHKPEIPYKELQDLSLRVLPYLKEEKYDCEITPEYNINSPSFGYYDSKFIYDKTGYWGNELYRFGIVYILNNGDLTPVFNTRGGVVDLNPKFLNIPVYNEDGNRHYINYNEENFKLDEESNGVVNENIKGVVKFIPTNDTDTIYGVNFKISNDVLLELKKYVKGFFFVRQTRIPTILALGITIGIDKVSRTPCIPTAHGVLDIIKNQLEKTHVTTKDILDVNYISEGFLHRYSFKFDKKSSSLWSKIGKTVAIVGAVVGVAAATVCTAGAAGVLAPLAGTFLAGAASMSVGTAALITGIAAGGAAIGMTAVAGIQDLRNSIKRNGEKLELKGRDTKTPDGYEIVEIDKSRKLVHSFKDRLIIKDPSTTDVQAILCPDYSVNLGYYNSIFTGHEHKIELTNTLGIKTTDDSCSFNYFDNDGRHFYIPEYYDSNLKETFTSKIMGVPDNVKAIGLGNKIFRSRAGSAEEAWRFEDVGITFKEETTDADDLLLKVEAKYKSINSDIIRGSFGPYLAITTNLLKPAETVNIYTPGFEKMSLDKLFTIRQNDNSPFFAISDRIAIFDIEKPSLLSTEEPKNEYEFICYRGDCYICQFTHRLNRNFNDSNAPYNDELVDPKTWKDNYNPDETEKYAKINLGDVNAVQLGMWVTFKIRSSNNLNIRTLDGSNVDETAMTGHVRGFYPYYDMITEGTYKHPDSQVYNKGFAKSIGDRWNFETPDVPHIKNWFGTRIMYSDIHINDAYKNGFRVFQGTNYRDYTREYGEIVKLVPLESSLLCVFEHGIALIPVNERAIAGQGSGGNVYINTSNVLPENPKIISDMFGSQWPESVLKVPGRTGDSPQYIYGVDTIAKKIWRTDGNSLECISDFRVLEFLNNNITLGERETTPKIGIRNVKTVYNAFKRDVMFTFYDNTYGFEEKVWNLCWNELLQKFITFYSWVPSYMENINNIPFSFDRNTSKWIAKLGTSHAKSSFADGITLTNVIIEDTLKDTGQATTNMLVPITYVTKQGNYKTVNVTVANVDKYIGALSLSNRVLPDTLVMYKVDFSLERDIQNNYKLFKIVKVPTLIDENGNPHEGGFILPEDAKFSGSTIPIYALCFNDGGEEYQPIQYLDEEFKYVIDGGGESVYTYSPLYKPEALYSELYYRNSAGNTYADYDIHKLGTNKIAYTNIPDRWIKDEETLTLLENELPSDTVIGNTSTIYNDSNPPKYVTPCTTLGEIRNLIKNDNGTLRVHGILLSLHWTVNSIESNTERKVWYELPIFKDITGKRLILPEKELVNPNNLVTLLNIKATINILDLDNTNVSMDDAYYNMKASYNPNTLLINIGLYESVVAVTPKWNLLFLSTDFWKHGLSGLIDVADDIFPTYWYGKQHPFEFECIVVNDPSTHKIFSNLELIANKAKPESFHYEIIGESYDFAKDKVNMYFRLEAMKALWQYNGADICYDRNFLKVQPRLQAKSADLPHKYYTRQDTVNNIEDYYITATYPNGYDYRHLSGGEIVYYPNRQEYRIWNHAKAVNVDELNQEDSRSLIAANCQYLEDRWKVTINPILVCYKNEYAKKFQGSLIQPLNSTWADSVSGNKLPPFSIYNSPIPDKILAKGDIEFPDPVTGEGLDNALYNLYNNPILAIDTTNWLNDVGIYKTNFGEAQNRKELDLKDKFIKIRIRYSGEELAVIDFLNTVYHISYA